MIVSKMDDPTNLHAALNGDSFWFRVSTNVPASLLCIQAEIAD